VPDSRLAPLAELLPEVTDLNRPYWEGLAAGEVRLQRCLQCSRYQHPPESFCYHCPSTDLAWETVPARGEIYSFIVVHQRYHAAFAEHLPYVVATVQLDEGPRLLAAMLFDEPDAVQIGARVKPRVEPVSEGGAVLLYTLDPDA
jgi:uncharacterized protein